MQFITVHSLNILHFTADFELMKNITHSCTLTELDLAGNKFSKEEQENLNVCDIDATHTELFYLFFTQFWSLPQLKVLKLDKTDLLELPGSVGRLQNLQELSLSKNKLTNLPITLENCKSLKKLSLNGNNFRAIPGVVLKLKALEDLRRLGNPLLERFNMANHPHITATLVKSAGKGPWNPISLQSLAARAVSSLTLTGQVNYWDTNLLPPRQCKLMDRLAPSYKYCEHCCKTITDTGTRPYFSCYINITVSFRLAYRVDILMLRFAGNVHVPFSFSACSETCKDVIVSEYTILQNKTQKQIDREYDEQMKQAQQIINNGEVVDTRMDVPDEQIYHFVAPNYRAGAYSRRRRRKRCSIM